MALQAKALSLLFLAIFLFSLQSQARDSQFFSKVPNPNNNEKGTPTRTTTVVIPNNDKKQEQEPNFIPETKNNGYGLYGHEYGQLPPSETTTANEERHFTTTTTTTPTHYEPYTTPVGPHYGSIETEDQEQEPVKKFNNAQLYGNNNEKENYYNQNAVKETRGYGHNNHNYNNYNSYDARERQGMSDTRYLENGMYYYDINGEKQYNPNTYDEKNYDPNTYRTNRVVDYSRNNENNNYYNNNKYKFYGNGANGNSHETNRYNDKYSFEGYQNEEFQENDNDFEP